MNSVRSQILSVIERDLKTIKEGNKIPNMPQNSTMTFNTSVKTVSRSLSQLDDSKLPALYLLSSAELQRHLLADVTVETMTVYVVGQVHSFDERITAQVLVNSLLDDVRFLLGGNAKFDGLARRSRILRSDHDTEIVEPDATFMVTLEVDYVEYPSYGSDPQAIPKLSIDCSLPTAQQIMNGFHNALATIEGISSVQRAEVWPIPNEQILRRDCPVAFYQAAEETYQYHGSQETTKRIDCVLMVVVFEPDPLSYQCAIDTWVAKVKNVLGDNADLKYKVNTIDIRAIRTVRSEYPVIYVETDLTIRYMQSFLRA